MSLVACNRKFERQLVELKQKGKLLIPSEIISKIHHLHHHVKSDEWSCVLVYQIVQGTVEDPENFVLRVKDIILMDIGNSTFTEYEFTPSDSYSFKRYTEALENGYKLGHIHSHHGMNCFFSGTDTAELHDNAPNHNFYLSLIVNFKNINDWCAAVAVCAEERTVGTITKTGNVKITRTWRGAEGEESEEEESDINKTEEINTINTFLYKINLTLVEEKSEDLSIDERIIALKAKKFSNIYNNRTVYSNTHLDNINNMKTHSGSGGSSSRFPVDSKEEGKKDEVKEGEKKKEILIEDLNKQFELALEKEKDIITDSEEDLDRVKDCYSPGKMKPLLIVLLGDKPEKVDLEEALDNFIKDTGSVFLQEGYIADLETKMQSKIDSYLKFNCEDLDYHCICVAFTDLLKPFQRKDRYAYIVKLMLDTFDLLINYSRFDPNVTEKYTGISFDEDESWLALMH